MKRIERIFTVKCSRVQYNNRVARIAQIFADGRRKLENFLRRTKTSGVLLSCHTTGFITTSAETELNLSSTLLHRGSVMPFSLSVLHFRTWALYMYFAVLTRLLETCKYYCLACRAGGFLSYILFRRFVPRPP